MNNRQIYAALKQQVIGLRGQITFTLGNITYVVEERDIVGNCIQGWLRNWFNANNINFSTKPNTQEFPDYIINPGTPDQEMLEIKAWNIDANPAFDVANFESYCSSLLTDAYRLDADYLIFGYRMTNGIVQIVDIWLKKIWEICGGSGVYPVKVQAKRNMIYNIRPVTWYNKNLRYKPFNSRREFVQALHQTLLQYHQTAQKSKNWFKDVCANYYAHTGKSL